MHWSLINTNMKNFCHTLWHKVSFILSSFAKKKLLGIDRPWNYLSLGLQKKLIDSDINVCVCFNCDRWTKWNRIWQQTSGWTGNATSICRMTADVITMRSTSAGVGTGWSFSTCDVHRQRKMLNSSTFPLYSTGLDNSGKYIAFISGDCFYFFSSEL